MGVGRVSSLLVLQAHTPWSMTDSVYPSRTSPRTHPKAFSIPSNKKTALSETIHLASLYLFSHLLILEMILQPGHTELPHSD